MEKEKRRKKEMMRRMFAPGGLIFRSQREESCRGDGGKWKNLKNTTATTEQEEPREPEEPPRSLWPVSSNGEPVIISVQPLHPLPEQPEPSDPPTPDPTSAPSTEDSVGGGEEVEEAPPLQPEIFTDPKTASEETSEPGASGETAPSRSLAPWISKPLQWKFNRDMKKSYERERKYGHQLISLKNPKRLICVAEHEQNLRQTLREKHEKLEKKWNK
ncbi:proteoglycan 4-like [Astyanax mexicanus]|uniref:Proteoglycan 4-like n=1 Tax=Astyanax mexicanus TaxID=7994 RepID=A0A8T2LY59_ASTMX|nr:proteoglycan 4-like [Astyanax mexicanus]